MERVIKIGSTFFKDEEKRIKNLLRGKVKIKVFNKRKEEKLDKLDDENRHANAEGK